MTVKDCLPRWRKYGAYLDWVSISEAKEMGLIPGQYWGIFAETCECGSENVISVNLRREMCCNPKCYVKEAFKLAEMFSRFGVLGLGYANCNSIYTALKRYDLQLKAAGKQGLFNYDSYTEVLLIPIDKFPASIRASSVGIDFITACNKVRNTPVTFAQLVSKLGLAGIGSNADKLFGDINSSIELREKIKEDGGVQAFCVKRGMYSPELMLDVANSLQDIVIAEFACKASMKRAGLYKMSVCITGRVVCDGKGMTKEQFIKECNEVCVDSNGVPMMEIKNVSGAATVPFVLYTTASCTEKFNVGRSRGIVHDEFGKHSALMTASDFYNWLKGAINRWNTERDLQQMNWIQILTEELQRMQEQVHRIAAF